MRLNSDELLALWRRHRGYESLRDDAATDRTDGTNLDLLLREQAEAWHEWLLNHGPIEALVVTDLAEALTPAARPDGSATLELPESMVRLLSIRLEGWQTPALITHAGSPLAARQRNSWSRGGAARPVAVVDGCRAELFSIPEGWPDDSCPPVAECRAVVRPPDGTFEFTPQAIATIPAWPNI